MRLANPAIFFTLTGFLLFPSLIAAEADKGKQVVEQAVQALGGDKFLNFHTRLMTGRVYSFFHDQLSGFDRARIYTEYLASLPPDGLGVRERELLGKKQDYSFLYLPTKGYEITFRGARLLEDDRWAKYRRTSENDIFYILKVRHNEPGFSYDYVGDQVLITRHVDVVDITDSKQQTVRVWFDYNSHFPIRQTFSWVNQLTKERDDEIANYDKFRDIGNGIYWPFTIDRSRNGYKIFQVFADSGEANVDPPPHTFDLPEGAKALTK